MSGQHTHTFSSGEEDPDGPRGVARMVHYVSHGTPPRPDGSQAYTSACRAAVITQVADAGILGLCVLNPTGMFFHEAVPHDEAGKAGGTWHWPEHVF